MIRISDINVQNTGLFLDRAVDIAEFYGFTPATNLRVNQNTTLETKGNRIDTQKFSFVRRDERPLVTMAHTCADCGIGNVHTPAFIWREGPTIRADGERFASMELHVLGVPTAVAEAILLVVTDAVAREAGIERRSICLNSIGTVESSARYLRDITNYLRKHMNDLPPTLRTQVSKDPLGVLTQLSEKGDELLERAPASLEYLNEEERKHFWDVLEYLEMSQLYYELNPHILGSRDCWAHTLFDVCMINDTGEHTPIARGGRYDPLTAACMGPNSAGAAVTIMCEMKGRATIKERKRPEPGVYFAHLGLEAKRRTLPVLEALRSADIQVHQSLAYEHIADQMRVAKRLKVPHMLIMGHKEATEGTVLVRETTTNSQEPVSIDYLPGYLKRRRIGVR